MTAGGAAWRRAAGSTVAGTVRVLFSGRVSNEFLLARPFFIRGDVHVTSDLTIEAEVRGNVRAPRHELTIGRHGRIRAQVHARAVVVRGTVRGDVSATDVVRVQETGRVTGNIAAERVVIADGARVQGRITAGPAAARGPAPEPRLPRPR